MPPPSSPTVVLFSAPGSLEGIDPLLKDAGVRLVRIVSVRPRPVPPGHWLNELRRQPTPDTIVVSSRNAVPAGVGPWRRSVGRAPSGFEWWAVGPGTALALRAQGIRRVHRPRSVGSTGLVSALRRRNPRTVLYLRSRQAGPALARRLRHEGHQVLDVVVYRAEPPKALSGRSRRAIAAANLLVVTSPSGVKALRRGVGAAAYARLRVGARLVVLGEPSRRAARRAGLQAITVAPSTTAQRFTRHVLRELRHGAS